MNNYRAHLIYEYHELRSSEAKQAEQTKRDGERVTRASEMVEICEKALEVATEHHARTLEQYRESHGERVKLRSELGEVESELFLNAEEQENWHQ